MVASARARSLVFTTPREDSKSHPLLSKPSEYGLCYFLRSDEFTVPAECVVKIFKTTLNEFKNRDRYIKGDYRFKGRYGTANARKLVKLWAEKEMHNLKRCEGGRNGQRKEGGGWKGEGG